MALVAIALPLVAFGGAIPAQAESPRVADAPSPAAAPVGGERMGERGLVADAALQPPPTSAVSYVVADAGTGTVFAARDPHGRYRPASTLKTLLALTMLPRLDVESTYVADAEDAAVEGARVGLVPGREYRIEDLWYGLMLRSGNDTANALAKAGARGDRATAVRMMNAEARRLQAFDTTAVNPSGLDEDGQFSSAYDLALFARAGLARADFSAYVRTVKREFPGNPSTSGAKGSDPFQMYTSNRLLLRGYPGAVGVKTGYTTLARNTLIAAAERDGRTIVVTLLGEPPGATYRDAEALLDWGFANAAAANPVGVLVEPSSPAATTPEDQSPVATSIRALEIAALRASGDASWTAPAARLADPLGLVALAVSTVLAASAAGVALGRSRRRRRRCA
ncbi:MAG: D-alanyl-D-alanine carboxypeptidase family protein [Sporichthyaceae bacterium]